MIDWLNYNSGAVTVILTALVVLVTGVYVYLTYRLLLESKVTREMAMRPVVIVTAEIHEMYMNIIHLRVRNIGGGAARRICLRTNRKFMIGKDQSLDDLGLFKRAIPLLGPGQKIETFLKDMADQEVGKEEPLEVTAKYEAAVGGETEETFVIDLAALENLRQVGETPLTAIAKSIKKIQENIQKSIPGGSGV